MGAPGRNGSMDVGVRVAVRYTNLLLGTSAASLAQTSASYIYIYKYVCRSAGTGAQGRGRGTGGRAPPRPPSTLPERHAPPLGRKMSPRPEGREATADPGEGKRPGDPSRTGTSLAGESDDGCGTSPPPPPPQIGREGGERRSPHSGVGGGAQEPPRGGTP